MIIALTIIALLIQFIGAYALIIQAQRTQDSGSEFADPHNQRGHQPYYNAFAHHDSGMEMRNELQVGTLGEHLTGSLNLGQNVPKQLQ